MLVVRSNHVITERWQSIQVVNWLTQDERNTVKSFYIYWHTMPVTCLSRSVRASPEFRRARIAVPDILEKVFRSLSVVFLQAWCEEAMLCVEI